MQALILFRPVFAVVIVAVLWALLPRVFAWINHRMSRGDSERAARLATLFSVLTSVIRYILVAACIMELLNALGFGITVTSLVATAGVSGVIIGIGAQSIVNDFLYGLFIISENQLKVGDYVAINGVSGFVEHTRVRVTAIRDWNGELHTITNGSIKCVTNKSVRDSLAIVNIHIHVTHDLDRAIQVMALAAKSAVVPHDDVVVEQPEVLGVVSVGVYGAEVRTVCKTLPMKHYAVERDIRKEQVVALVGAGMIPDYRSVLSIGEEGKREGV